MTIATPTLEQLRQRFWAALTAEIPDLINAPQHSIARVLMDVWAGEMKGAYQTQIAIANASNPATAEGEYLNGWAQAFGLQRKADETDEELRYRLFLRLRHRIEAGTKTDWEQWTLAQENVTSVWVLDENPPAVEIFVYNSRAVNGMLTDDQLAALHHALDTYRPAGADVSVHNAPITEVDVQLQLPNPVPGDLQAVMQGLAISEHGFTGFLNPAVFYQAAQMTGTHIQVNAPLGNYPLAPRTIPILNFTSPPE